MAERTAAVVGGGIGGLATAAGLLRRGWSVQVLEQAAEFTEVGAGISLWANGFRALDAIGLGERVRALGSMDVSAGLRDHRGRWIVRTDKSGLARRHSATAVMLHRSELMRALLDAVPAECLTAGTRVHAVRPANGRAVVVHDRGESTVDLVIGADGVRSTVRTQVWPDAAAPRYAGSTAWRMVLPSPLTGPFAGGESWGSGAVFGAFPMSKDRVYCYATDTVEPGGASPDGELAGLRRRFGDWHHPIPALLAAATSSAVLRNDLYYLPPLPSFTSGRVVLLGDAAHAMTPHLGQGANQALEDAATLVAVLDTEPDDLAAALRRYDELRRPRTQKLVRRSRMGGRVAQLAWPPAIVIRNAALRVVPASIFIRSLTATLEWQPPGHTDQTSDVLT